MSTPEQDDAEVLAYLGQHHPTVKVTPEMLNATRPAPPAPPAPVAAVLPPAAPQTTPAPTPTATLPVMQNGPRGDSVDDDAQRFEQYMRASFPGVLPTRT